MKRLPVSSVRDLGGIRPRLRADLRFTVQPLGGQRSCVMEDPVRSQFHRLGLAEYELIRAFDGVRSFSEAFAHAAARAGEASLTEREAVSLLGWLVEHRLVDLGGAVPDARLADAASQRGKARLLNTLNLLSIRFPLGNPSRGLRACYPLVRGLCSHLFFALWATVVLTGILTLRFHWTRWSGAMDGVLAPGNWLGLILVFVFVKVWHEFWHALVCEHHGGEVREAGILLILLMPLGYVDASSSLHFRSRWKRFQVAAAGMYGELFLAAIAVLIWAGTSEGLVNTLARNTVVTASIVTLVFNLNPLMRFDGYHMLCDALDLPNLSTRAQARLREGIAWLFLGDRADAWEEIPRREVILCLIYAVAAGIWRVMILFTLLVAASRMFRGGGLIFAVLAAGFSLTPMVKQSGGGVWKRLRRASAGARWRAAWVSAGLLLLLLLPVPGRFRAPAVYRHGSEEIHRAEAPGFMAEVAVRDGQGVKPGDPLLRLENPEVTARLARRRLERERQALRVSSARVEGSPAVQQAEEAVLRGLESQVTELENFVESLSFQSRLEGVVVAGNLLELLDVHVKRGDEVLRVVSPGQGELVVPVPVREVEEWRLRVGYPVRIYRPGSGRTFSGVLRNVAGRAVYDILQPELTRLGGGPLAVRQGGEGNPELLAPVFWAVVEPGEDESWPDLRAGELLRIRLQRPGARRLGLRLSEGFFHTIDNWMDRALRRVEDA